jgi:hypothetical protein
MNVGTNPGFGPCRISASSPRQARPATSSVESGLSLSLDPEALDGPKAVEPCLSPFFHLVPGVLNVPPRRTLVSWLE